MESDELTVDPGSQITTTVTVRNLGTRVEEFQLIPQGPGAAFASITPDTLSVYPDLEQRAVVRFAPLRGPESAAGVTTFEVVACSVVHSDVRDVARGRLTVTPFHDLSAVLTPDVSRGRKPGRHVVSVTNGGNTPVGAQLDFKAQDGALTFEPQQGTSTLQPGDKVDLPVLINGGRRWFGRTERLPFSAVVTPPEPHPLITLNGTRQQTAIFPWWMPIAAVAILALAIGLAALLRPGPPTVPVIPPVDEAAAVKQLEDADYVPEPVKAGDDTVAEGLAIRTDPAGGTELKHGERVKLFISTGKCPEGPCPVEVPNVVGKPVEEATTLLEGLKFTVRTDRVASAERPVDHVIASDPAATTPRPVGSDVTLTVSTGPGGENNPSAPVPPVAAGQGGSPAEDKAAAEKAAAEEQKVAEEKVAEEKVAAEKVAAEKAAADKAAADKAAAKPVKVPDLKGNSVLEATAALEKLGLTAKTENEHSNAVPDGKVLSTKPGADSEAKPGSEVALTVAQNTRVDLIAAANQADQASWKDQAGTDLEVTDEATGTGVARTLKDGSPVLVTTPGPGGSITGVYTLKQPIISGDHLRAQIGLLTDADKFKFLVKADDKPINTMIKTVRVNNIPFQELDADLSSAKDATKIEITVENTDTTAQPAEWRQLRLASPTG